MKMYLAGNFPAMKDPKLERRLMRIAHLRTGQWKRLVSFHFEPDIQTVFDLKRVRVKNESRT